MPHFMPGVSVERKVDGSPVTKADEEADAYIVEQLKAFYPDIPVVSEEGAKPDVSKNHMFWLVDGLDGTKSFVKGGKNWTVNIALIVDGKPQFGVVYSPENGVMYAGDVGAGAFKIEKKDTNQESQNRQDRFSVNQIHTRPLPKDGATVILSHHHKEGELLDLLPDVNIKETINASSSIKFCKIAEGTADIYPRSGPTMEWDTAAGQAVLEAAGGVMLDEHGKLFTYGKSGFKNGAFSVYGQAPVQHETVAKKVYLVGKDQQEN